MTASRFAVDELVNSNQTGSPSFPFGIRNKGNNRATEGGGVTSLTVGDAQIQNFNLSANQTCKLPATGVTAGDTYKIINNNQFVLSVQANDSSALIKMWGMSAEFMAISDNPTTSSDWKILSRVYLIGTEWTQYTPSFNGITVTGASTKVFYKRDGDSWKLRGNLKIATVGAGGLEMSLPLSGVVDTNKLNFVVNSTLFGFYQRLDGSNWNPITQGGAMGEVFYNTGAAAGFLSFGPITSGTANEYLPTASNSVFGANEDVAFQEVSVPISYLAES